MSMSGWWPAFSAASPTLLTKAKEARKSLKRKVRTSSPDSICQSGTETRRDWISLSERGDMKLLLRKMSRSKLPADLRLRVRAVTNIAMLEREVEWNLKLIMRLC